MWCQFKAILEINIKSRIRDKEKLIRIRDNEKKREGRRVAANESRV